MSAAAILERDLRNVHVPDRVERAVDFSALDAVDEPPRFTVFRALGELMADLAAVGGRVDRFDPSRPERDGFGMIEAPFDLHAICAKNRLSLFCEGFRRFLREPVPDLEFARV